MRSGTRRTGAALALAAAMALATRRSNALERAAASGQLEHAPEGWRRAAHLAIFVVRKAISILARRLLGAAHHPYWSPVEELVVKILAFVATIGDVKSTRYPIKAYGLLQRAVHAALGSLHVTRVDLGLGQPHAKDALYLALEKDQPLGSCPIILYFHGGGYVTGCAEMYINSHFRWLQRLRDDHGFTCAVLSVEYPLAPEVRFPGNLQFCFRAYDAVVHKLGISPASIIVSGDSAGGGIAYNVALHARDEYPAQEGHAELAGLVLISPWVNHAVGTESFMEHRNTDFLPRESMKTITGTYADDEHDPFTNPAISLVHGEFGKLPPVALTYGTREVFKSDIVDFQGKLEAAGNQVQVSVGPECPHIYPLLAPLFSTHGSQTLSELAAFCASCLSRAASSKPGKVQVQGGTLHQSPPATLASTA